MLFHFLDNLRDRIRDWAVRHAEGQYSRAWLAALSFAEASFFPIPPDVVLIAILLGNRARRWISYASLTTAFSVLGGALGYAIGFFFFDMWGGAIVSFYGLEDAFVRVKSAFGVAAFWTIFAAAFTPIPYKIFTITAGLFAVNFPVFILASLIGRGIRFFAIAYLLKRYGEKIADVLYRYFNLFSFAALVILIALAYAFF